MSRALTPFGHGRPFGAATRNGRSGSAPALPATSERSFAFGSTLHLIGAAGGYILIYLYFYPRTFTTSDESTYMNMAYAIRHGSIYSNSIGLGVVGVYPVHGHLVSKYPPGMPAILAIVSFLGWRVALGTNLVLHLATFAVVAKLLRTYGVSCLFAELYLFHPTAALYSRTVMADTVSGLLIAVAFWGLMKQRYISAGAILGAAVLFRSANGLALVTFGLGTIWESYRAPSTYSIRRAVEPIARLALGASPFMWLAAYYAIVVQAEQSQQHTGYFSLRFIPHLLPVYCVGLLTMYPAMLIAPSVFRGSHRFTLVATIYGFVLLYSAWYFEARGSNELQTFVLSLRYFLVVLPLLVLTYAVELQRHGLRAFSVATRAGVALGLGVSCLAGGLLLETTIASRHDALLRQREAVRLAIIRATGRDDLLIVDANVAKLLHPAFGERTAVLVDSPATAQVASSAIGSRGSSRVVFATWPGGSVGDVSVSRAAAAQVTSLERTFRATSLPPAQAESLPAGLMVQELH